MRTIYKLLCICFVSVILSCNSYLDEVPDNRTEIDTPQKAALLLAGSYPTSTYAPFLNPRIDNVSDKGEGTEHGFNTYSFLWRDIEDTVQDTPEHFWQRSYYSVAGANGALNALDEMKGKYSDAEIEPYRGEALVLRSFAHFLSGIIFCKFYDTETNDSNMGIPYLYEQETIVNKQHVRGTVTELWNKIEKDLVEGLSLIGSDDYYGVPKFHMNKVAAHAYASRFYLYKGQNADLQRSIDVANAIFPQPDAVADGQNVPASDLANVFAMTNFQPWLTTYRSHTSSGQIKQDYTLASNPSNLLIADVVSRLGSYVNSWRYSTTSKDTQATVTSPNPTGGSWGYRVYNSSPLNWYCPKFKSFLKTESINATAGVFHAVFPFLRIEEVLLNRAEAYARLDDLDRAIADLNIFCRTRVNSYNEIQHMLTKTKILNFYKNLIQNEEFYMNKYNAYGSASWSDEKKAIVHFILICRQNEFIYEGLRYWDMVRYKMEVKHVRHEKAGGAERTLYPGDDRWVIQIPETAVLAGLELNPRENILSPLW